MKSNNIIYIDFSNYNNNNKKIKVVLKNGVLRFNSIFDLGIYLLDKDLIN